MVLSAICDKLSSGQLVMLAPSNTNNEPAMVPVCVLIIDIQISFIARLEALTDSHPQTGKIHTEMTDVGSSWDDKGGD